MLSRLHQDCLASILGPDLIVHELEPAATLGVSGTVRALGGRIDGVSPAAEQAVLERIGRDGVTCVYLNGSNLGRLARTIKRSRPQVTVLTFFHNVEARFFLGALRRSPSPRAAAVLIANHAAERMAVRFSNRLLALSARDSLLLRRLYGREATDIVPMALADQLDPARTDERASRTGYALFVGGAFYANQAGILWFADKVAPHIGMKTVVIGHGMEALREKLAHSATVDVVGAVSSLQDWYRDAAVAIAPIFDGSGMKTKVAEALMFGKRILATSEALAGYEQVGDALGGACDTSDAFIGALESIARSPAPAFDPELRRLYEAHHSPAALRGKLAELLGSRLEGSAPFPIREQPAIHS